MPWSTPVTAVANAALTAAQWNASVRDNLLETSAAKATTPGYHFVSTGVNSVAERAILTAFVDTQESTTSVTFVDLTTDGPAVTLTTGTKALVWINAQMSNTSAQSVVSTAITGPTNIVPNDARAIVAEASPGASNRYGVCDLLGVTAGVNTIAMKYRVTAGTGSFLRRRMQVMGL